MEDSEGRDGDAALGGHAAHPHQDPPADLLRLVRAPRHPLAHPRRGRAGPGRLARAGAGPS
eukprot:scaffold75149_cov59-Phaeocystis_antarctica.AAC.1